MELEHLGIRSRNCCILLRRKIGETDIEARKMADCTALERAIRARIAEQAGN